jgi:dihydrofolate reductase
MRKVILSVNITLDGFMAGPRGELDWHMQQWNDEMGEYAFQQLSNTDTILVGRVTYQAMANFWPQAFKGPGSKKGDIAYAHMMNSYPKIVFSKTLSTVDWRNSRLVKENIREEVVNMKQQPGKDMIMWGGVGIVSTFIQMGLIDEYRVWVAPVILGNGMRPGLDAKANSVLQLLNTVTFSNGVVMLCYRCKPN